MKSETVIFIKEIIISENLTLKTTVYLYKWLYFYFGGSVRSHLTPRNLGCSPGADVSVSIFRLSMWAMEMTVAATYHGRPMKEQTTNRTATQNRSRW